MVLCDICGKTKNIEKHHIVPNNSYIKHPNITVPLCKECHIKVHLFYNNSKLAIDTHDEYLQCFREYELSEYGDKHILKKSLLEYFNRLYLSFKKEEEIYVEF